VLYTMMLMINSVTSMRCCIAFFYHTRLLSRSTMECFPNQHLRRISRDSMGTRSIPYRTEYMKHRRHAALCCSEWYDGGNYKWLECALQAYHVTRRLNADALQAFTRYSKAWKRKRTHKFKACHYYPKIYPNPTIYLGSRCQTPMEDLNYGESRFSYMLAFKVSGTSH